MKRLSVYITNKLQQFQRTLQWAKTDKRTRSFIKHNRKVWKNFTKIYDGGEILFEVNSMHSAVISYGYLANVLAKKYNAKIVGYELKKRKLAFAFLKPVIHRVFKSFNAQEIISIDLTSSQADARDRMFAEIYPTLKSKKDVEDLKLEGLWIGDLLYDSHLKRNRVPTILIENDDFSDSLREAIGIYIFWRDYFDTHTVRAVNVSHCVYTIAIILRVAVQREIPVYQINATNIYFLSENNLWAYNDFFNFPVEFQKLSPSGKKGGLVEAKQRLKRRFSGEIGVDMSYSSRSAYSLQGNLPVLVKSERLKVFVALHCFFDSPHPYGVNLFPDHYEWVDFLGRISEKTDYDWYLKTHPDFLSGNVEIIEHFLAKYPKFNLLPSDTSHHQIINDGIDFALTVYGTIGFEYASFGIPVINASQCNPHIAYDFNIHPPTIKEYEQVLMNLADQKLSINLDEIYEYYFMKFIKNSDNWLFNRYNIFLDEYGGYHSQFSPLAYEVFLKEYSPENHDQILATLFGFVESRKFRYRIESEN